VNVEKTQTTFLFGRLPYVTSKQSKIAGKICLSPNDFQVEEIESYRPLGEGEHLFVRFRKTGLSTPEAVARIARALGTDPKQASWAGLKDRNAITEQWASFFGGDPAKASALNIEGIDVLEAAFHPHKLRTGHLRGNRFRIYVRETSGDSYEIATTLLSRLDQAGIPNYYGEQRFGFRRNNLEHAKRWFIDGEKAPHSRFSRKFYFSVIQSAIFNAWLARRLQNVPIDCPVEGDLLRKEDTGGMFTTDDIDDARIRMKNWEISPTGPIFGEKMRWPEGRAREMEMSILAQLGISVEMFKTFRKYGAGSRRTVRVRPHQWKVREEINALALSFQLPKGAYATTVLRELLKPQESIEDISAIDDDVLDT